MELPSCLVLCNIEALVLSVRFCLSLVSLNWKMVLYTMTGLLLANDIIQGSDVNNDSWEGTP